MKVFKSQVLLKNANTPCHAVIVEEDGKFYCEFMYHSLHTVSRAKTQIEKDLKRGSSIDGFLVEKTISRNGNTYFKEV